MQTTYISPKTRKANEAIRRDPQFQIICARLNECTDPAMESRLRKALQLLITTITARFV